MANKQLLTKEEQQALKEARLVWKMSETEGFKEICRPWLETRLNQSFPDPSKFKDEREFFYAAAMASTFKKVIAEILMWIDAKKDEALFLSRKEKGENKDNFNIGE